MKDCDKDYIEKRLHSHTQTIEKNVFSIMKGFEEIKAEIPKAIQVTVNGKIDRLHKEMTEHNQRHDEALKEILMKVNDLKVETAPIIESKNTIVGLRKGLLYFATPIAVAYALWQFIIEKFK